MRYLNEIPGVGGSSQQANHVEAILGPRPWNEYREFAHDAVSDGRNSLVLPGNQNRRRIIHHVADQRIFVSAAKPCIDRQLQAVREGLHRLDGSVADLAV